jgi:N-acetylglucosamine-6-phosphate deacetylase
MNSISIYTASKIFTGTDWLNDCAIIVEEGVIKKLQPASSVSASANVHHFDNCIIVPAFIDVQIYGASEKLFAVYPDIDALQKLNEYSLKGGAAYCLPTVATNTYEIFYNCIDAIRKYWDSGGQGIVGLHLEGPWINTHKRGAHVEACIHTPTLQQVKQLLDYGKGVIKMITLAPEVCSEAVLQLIQSHHVIISAGHSNATYAEAKAGFTKGITTVTHLYNAMSALQHRQPGLAGATMEDAKITASIIPDGHHVDYAAIRIAKKVMGERLFAITDAVTTTTEGFYKHHLAGDKYEADGILSGSALTMHKALQNLVNYCDISVEEAIRMCSLYPAKVLRLDNHVGKISEGYKASFLVVDNELNVVTTIPSQSPL